MNGVLNMKSDFKKIFRKRILPTVLAVLALSVCSITAFAVGEDDSQTPDPQPDPVVTEYQNQYVETQATDSTEFQAPTIAKTVSEKKYSTSYTAGIVSWICVGLGVVAIAVVMISTKVGARKRIR